MPSSRATWLTGREPSNTMFVVGDPGRGKSFLLRQLARRLPDSLPELIPILVDLRGLEGAPGLDELLVQHLVRNGQETIELSKLRYMVRSGRLALLLDGFDELVLRIGDQHATDYLGTLLDAGTDRTRIVMTGRTHPASDSGILSAATSGTTSSWWRR